MTRPSNNQADLKDRLAQRASSVATAEKPKSPADSVAAYLKKMGPEIAKALPKHMDADRLARVALTTIRTNPTLLQCNVPSLLAGVMQAAQLGLEPGLLGHCYLIPFRNNKANTMDVQFIIGYRGMIDLARRSGNIETIYAHEVCEKDEFELEYGLDQRLKHKPATGERGEVMGVYGVAKFKDGGYYFEYLPKAEIEKRRGRSKAAGSGPWVTDWLEMAKKTVIRHMFKYLPISVEVMTGVTQDETAKREISEDMNEVPDTIDITPIYGEQESEPTAPGQGMGQVPAEEIFVPFDPQGR